MINKKRKQKHTQLKDASKATTPQKCIEIRHFSRIKNTKQATAWKGVTSDGKKIHICYQLGELTIQVDILTGKGKAKSETILRWRPKLALRMLALNREYQRAISMASSEHKNEVRKLFLKKKGDLVIFHDHEVLREMKSQARVSDDLLKSWLEKHRVHFSQLTSIKAVSGIYSFIPIKKGFSIEQ